MGRVKTDFKATIQEANAIVAYKVPLVLSKFRENAEMHITDHDYSIAEILGVSTWNVLNWKRDLDVLLESHQFF